MSELNRANRNLELAHEEYIRSDYIADCAEGILDAAEFYRQQLTTITKQRDELLSTLYDIYNEAVDYQSRTGKPVTWCLKVGNLLSTIKEQKDAE